MMADVSNIERLLEPAFMEFYSLYARNPARCTADALASFMELYEPFEEQLKAPEKFQEWKDSVQGEPNQLLYNYCIWHEYGLHDILDSALSLGMGSLEPRLEEVSDIVAACRGIYNVFHTDGLARQQAGLAQQEYYPRKDADNAHWLAKEACLGNISWNNRVGYLAPENLRFYLPFDRLVESLPKTEALD